MCSQTAFIDVEQVYYRPINDHEYDPGSIDDVRDMLHAQNEMAVGDLIYSALQHASEGMTHTDQKVVAAYNKLRSMSRHEHDEYWQQVRQVASEVKHWVLANPVKAAFMFLGLGCTAYKAKTIAQIMQATAKSFIQWGQSASAPMRFLGFVGLMMIRLFCATIVPPTSPGFGVILEAATPESEKWTAMPFFLAASTVAGVLPFALDKLLQVVAQEDFLFTKLMKRFVDNWPLTCWTGPTMQKVFHSVGGGKMGASLAVIFAHAAPFMGAQTTNIQRYFLPHPLDTIISQPFGMSEDLLSMAVAEATSSPVLASISLTGIIAGFNLAQFTAFSGRTDRKALLGALLNMAMGLFVACTLLKIPAEAHHALVIVSLQLLLQIFLVPIVAGGLSSKKLCRTSCNRSSPILDVKPQRAGDYPALLTAHEGPKQPETRKISNSAPALAS